jgi:prepilin peptidase CpaA
MLHSIILFAAATALLFAAVHDVAVRTVPNRMSLIVAMAGLGLNALDGHFVSALFSGAMVFAAGWYCWRRGWIGGGDVKLLTACAFLVPPASVPELILSTAIAGGLLALFYMALARVTSGDGPRMTSAGAPPRPAGLLPRVWRAERRRIRRGLSLPYSCAIAAGVALTLCSPVSLG